MRSSMRSWGCVSAIVFVAIWNLATCRDITIGGLFDSEDESMEIAFRYAVAEVNKQRWLLPTSILRAQIERVDPDDSQTASKHVCSMLKLGVAAIFGPQSAMTASHVQSICDSVDIPHIEMRWDYPTEHKSSSINLYPHPGTLSGIYAELLQKFNWWTTFTILYEHNEGLARMQSVLKMASKEITINVRQLIGEKNDFREVLRDVKLTGHTKMVIDCSTRTLEHVLKQLQQVGMMTKAFEYIITNLDFQTLNLEDYQYGDINITGLRIVDSGRPEVERIVSEWQLKEIEHQRVLNFTEKNLTVEAALLYDAVMVFAIAFTELDRSYNINTTPLSCDTTTSWVYGNSLINYMQMITLPREAKEAIPGYPVEIHEQPQTLTGKIMLSEGSRMDFDIDFLRLTEREGLVKIGSWSRPLQAKSGVNIVWPSIKKEYDIKSRMKQRSGPEVFRVTSILSPGGPYFRKKTDHEVLTGNDLYEGYMVDLMTEVAKVANFSFTIAPVRDGKYGGQVNGVWNGVIKDLLDEVADIAAADLTITSERGEIIDFTTPFLNLGVSILFKKPTKAQPSLLSFLSPFSVEVWVYMMGAYISVSIILFILARFSPYEWDNPYPCIQEPEELENSFTMLNSLWFTIGSLMQQGSDIAPKAVSTRLVAGMWWFFTLIMISSYTANLAAFLTVEPPDVLIEGAEDLVKHQGRIKYGAMRGGSTFKFFKGSTHDTYAKMGHYMEVHQDDVLMTTNEAGKERVMKEQYAFLMESTTIEFIVDRECSLQKVGPPLDSKGYGMAVRKNSELRERLTNAILILQEREELQRLKKRWWQEKLGGGQCAESVSASGSANPLSISNVGGVFVVLMTGMGLSCIVAICEFVWQIRKTVRENRGSLRAEMMNELKFVVKCTGSTKPVRKASPESENGLIGGYSGLNSKDT